MRVPEQHWEPLFQKSLTIFGQGALWCQSVLSFSALGVPSCKGGSLLLVRPMTSGCLGLSFGPAGVEADKYRHNQQQVASQQQLCLRSGRHPVHLVQPLAASAAPQSSTCRTSHTQSTMPMGSSVRRRLSRHSMPPGVQMLLMGSSNQHLQHCWIMLDR
ncbi:hypothetical protein WJX74_007054 [Apatococcus lobatus]|uniref:Uncharacterized protein n=1 Tax=Apatococcus lobatus TaxID=904363 RepID=A0AAW1RJ51_9CHLO